MNRGSEARAVALLSNYFYFGDLLIDDIYQMRRALEPELAASLAGRLSEEQLARLETAIAQSAPPVASTHDEAECHAASLRFHVDLAEMSENPLLRFVIRFLAEMLSEITIARGLHNATAPELWASGLAYQARLVAALRAGDAATARAVLQEHMDTALALMRRQEATVNRRFLRERAKPGSCG